MGKIKINYQDLLDNGFRQHGNWYIKDNVSVNLLGQKIFHNKNPGFCIDLEEVEPHGDIKLEDIRVFSDIMTKLTGG